MVRLAAKIIGLLTAVLVLIMWIVLNNHLPGSVGLGVNLIAILVAALTGLFAYVTVLSGSTSTI